MIRKLLALFMIVIVAGCGGKSKDELFSKGVEELKKGNPNGAIVLLKSALEKDQNFLDARYQLAMAYLDSGKFEHAEREFQKVLRQNPTKIDTYLQLARTYNLLRKADEAIKASDEFLSHKQDDAVALEYKGVAYGIKNNLAKAEEFLVQAIKSDPKRVSAMLELTSIYMREGREDEAREQIGEILAVDNKHVKAYYLLAQFEMSKGNKDKALEIYRKISAMDSNDVTALYRMGIIYLEQGDVAKAEEIASQLAQKFPKKSESSRLIGIIQFKEKKFSEALAALQNSIKLQPTVEGFYFLGLTQYSMGQLESAISQFRSILDRVPEHHRARLMIGMILLQQKRVDDAIAESRKVIASDPQNALAHNVLGSAYLVKGNYDEGMRELSRAIELDPKLIDAHLKKGLFQLSRGKDHEAEAEFQAAVNVSPEVLNSRLLLSSYYSRHKNYGKALSILDQGLTGKNEDAVIFNVMASIFLAEGKTTEAIKYFQKAKTINPLYFPSYFNLATHFASKGAYDRAAAEYQAILNKDHKNIKALLSLAAMNELRGHDTDALEYYKKAYETRNDVAFMAMAGYFARKKDIAKAINVLDDAYKSNSQNISALEVKGKLLVSENKFTEALKVFDDIEQQNQNAGITHKINTYLTMKEIPKALNQAQRFITLKPNSAFGYTVLATIYESQNDLNKAIDELSKGIKVEPENVQTRLKLGFIYAKRRDFGMAMSTFSRILRDKPDYAPAIFAQGTIFEQSGKKQDAVKKYREALAKEDNYVPALNNLAYLAAEGHGSKDEALRLAMMAYKLEPGNPGILDTLGYALFKSGKIDDSVKILEKASTLLPNNPTVMYHYALALTGSGEHIKAKEKLSVALKLGNFPDFGNAKKLHDELSFKRGQIKK